MESHNIHSLIASDYEASRGGDLRKKEKKKGKQVRKKKRTT